MIFDYTENRIITIAHLYSKHLEMTIFTGTEKILLRCDILPIKCR